MVSSDWLWPSETNAGRWDMMISSRTVDWWSKILLLVALSQDGHTQSILWRPLVANFISVKNLPWRCRRNWCYWVVHLPLVKERLFNCSVTTVSFFMLSVFSILVKSTWLNNVLWWQNYGALKFVQFFSGTLFNIFIAR